MKKLYPNIIQLIENELMTKEKDSNATNLMKKCKNIKKRGYFTKNELLAIGKWKSPRPTKNYLRNSDESIQSISKKVFATHYEKRRIELLISLKGISVPTASAILTIVDPENYGVIDIRTWTVLYTYGVVKTKPKGTGLTFKNWYNYLMKLRYYAKKFNVKARDIDNTLFWHHRKMQQGHLYEN